ncbi:hypothetical protein H0E87_025749 [Populus deltoides]|uniref:Uncharacterized protein n=1 Tax=Populus deltoides TaxID=3696 RepID=A0A8T2X2D6_POPDE|nr:hypothetical protein H0E87_025749 [Populus deltoides]
MSKGTVHQTRQQHGWDTTSDDYHAYISKLSRMPSVLHGAPQYPSVRKASTTRNQKLSKKLLMMKLTASSSRNTRALNCANGRPSSCHRLGAHELLETVAAAAAAASSQLPDSMNVLSVTIANDLSNISKKLSFDAANS